MQWNDSLTWLTSLIDQPLYSFTDKAIANGVALAAQVLLWVGAVVIGVYGLVLASGRVAAPAQAFMWKVGVVVFILLLETQANYSYVIRDAFMTGVPHDLAAIVNNVTGSTFGPHAFSVLINQVIDAAVQVSHSIGRFNVFGWILLGVFVLVAGAAVAFGYGVWLEGHVLVVIYVSIGPLLLPLYLVPATRAIVSAWFGCTVSAIVLQLLAVMMAFMVSEIEGTILKQIITSTEQLGMQTVMIVVGGIVFFYAYQWSKRLPSIATAICGGIHFSPNAMRSVTYDAVGSGIKSVASAATGGYSKMLENAKQGLRPEGAQRPPGPSLSRAPAVTVGRT